MATNTRAKPKVKAKAKPKTQKVVINGRVVVAKKVNMVPYRANAGLIGARPNLANIGVFKVKVRKK